MRKKRRKIKYKNILLLVGLIVLIVIIFKKGPEKEEKDIITADVIDSYVGKKISDLEDFSKKNNLTINKSFKYSREVSKDSIISTQLNGEKIDVIISSGEPATATASLWIYLRLSQMTVSPSRARAQGRASENI